MYAESKIKKKYYDDLNIIIVYMYIWKTNNFTKDSEFSKNISDWTCPDYNIDLYICGKQLIKMIISIVYFVMLLNV